MYVAEHPPNPLDQLLIPPPKKILFEFYPSSQVHRYYLSANVPKSLVQTILIVHIIDNICVVLNLWKQEKWAS